jgi:hypothetical protein
MCRGVVINKVTLDGVMQTPEPMRLWTLMRRGAASMASAT